MQPEDDDSKSVRITFKEADQPSGHQPPREGGEGSGPEGGGGGAEGGEGRENGGGRMQRRGRRRGRNGKLGKRDRQAGAPKADFVPNPEAGEAQGFAEGGTPAAGENAAQGSEPAGNGQAANRNSRTPRVARGPGARGQRRGNRDKGDKGDKGENRENRENRAGGKQPKGGGGQQGGGNGGGGNGNSGGEDHKLQKLLAEAGLGSRRDMEEAITAGRASVNGKTATLGQRITRRDVVRFDGKQVKIKTGREAAEVIIYHKPVGEIVSHDDPEGRPSVFDNLPAPKSGKWLAIGRLDFNTEGLLILTTSGDLANKMMHPRYEVEREYSVRVIGELTDDQMDQLLDGVELEDGAARFMKLEEGHFSDETPGINRWYDVMIREGRNREVRRMFEAVGVTVSRLIRTRFGPILLPRALRRGQMRALTALEIKDLQRAAAPASKDQADGGLPGMSGMPGMPGVLDDPDMDEFPEGEEPNGNVLEAPRSVQGQGQGQGRKARNQRGNKKRGGPPAAFGGGEANGNVAQPRGRQGQGQVKGRKARGAPAAGPGTGIARKGRGKGPAQGQGQGAGKRRGKRGIDPNSMTLDGRRAVKRRGDDDMMPTKPVHTPVIIHRRSKLKLVPGEGGGEGGES
ncbi:MAG TPA: pseudouridine synthase [Burkholderiales bacterium]|jgi:23S rRNA pseudouridine2605 synthase